MKSYINLLHIKLLLMLAGLMLCVSATANDTEPSTSTQANTENSAASADQASMSWSMLPGESLNDVARLFYPKNKQMQQRFIAKTMLLSRETQPNLDPAATSTQGSLIVIPNIKLLSRQGGENKSARSKLHKTEGTARLVIGPTIQSDYDYLVERNAFFKQELEKLNIKLAYLQQILGSLKDEVMRIVNRVLPAPAPAAVIAPAPAAVIAPVPAPVITPAPAAVLAPIPAAKLVKQKQDAVIQKNQSQDNAVKNRSIKSIQASTSTPTSVHAAPSNTEQAAFIPQQLMMPILALLVVIGLFLGLGLYLRQKAKNSFIKVSNFTRYPASALNKADSSTLQSEFMGSIAEPDAEAAKAMDHKEEGELVLEQAKIYVNLYREREAIALLQAYIQAAPKAASHHWLYLLDIYRNSNQKEEFLKCAEQLHRSFNVIMPQWEKTTLPFVIAPSLEGYSSIAEKVTRLWADCEKESKKLAQTKGYLDELLTDNRNGERRGFSMEVFQEIMLLRNMLDMREKLAPG